MWRYPRHLKGLASKQTPEKVLPWSISPSRYRHSKKSRQIACSYIKPYQDIKNRVFISEIPYEHSIWCERRDLNPYAKDTRPSNVPVCQFQHSRDCKGHYIKTPGPCQHFFILFLIFLFFDPPASQQYISNIKKYCRNIPPWTAAVRSCCQLLS